MPRHRSEEKSSSSSSRSSSSSSNSSPRSERSSSRPRTSSSSSSRSSHSSARSSPSPRPSASSGPSFSTESSTPRASSYSSYSSNKTEKSAPHISSYSQSSKQTDHDYFSSGSSSGDSGEGMSFEFIDSIMDAFRSWRANYKAAKAAEVPEKSAPRTATYIPPPHHDDDYDSAVRRRSREVVSGTLDGILDIVIRSPSASKEDPAVNEITNSSGTIACVRQAKNFQDCLDKYETKISKCQSYMDLWCKCKKIAKKDSDTA
ncbi:hypothetical protein AALP_AA8G089000 [Arabis alpina]|uniref:CHCH domain-containing protein n=1 Tax=Arabis alpina TaxID=50452 RepID=A0A087G5V8_ARAAL|nr:hypothetical protein AALP_AA8G089000 [Arabis alpina]